MNGYEGFVMLCIASAWLIQATLVLKRQIAKSGMGYALLFDTPEALACVAIPLPLFAWSLSATELAPSWFCLALAGLMMPIAVGSIANACLRYSQDEKLSARPAFDRLFAQPSRSVTLKNFMFWTVFGAIAAAVFSFVLAARMVLVFDQDLQTWAKGTLFFWMMCACSTWQTIMICRASCDLWLAGFVRPARIKKLSSK